MTLEYRKAIREDIPRLIELRKLQLIDEGQNPDADINDELYKFFEKQFDNDTLVEWLVEENGVIKGTAAIAFIEFPPAFTNPSGIKGYVTNMYTVPECRGKGIAYGLLDRLAEEAKRRGVSIVLLAASNMGAPVYQRFGFQKADEWMHLKL